VNSIHEQQIKQRAYADAQQQNSRGLSAVPDSAPRVPEIEYEINKLADAVGNAHRLYNDLNERLASVRSLGPVSSAETGYAEAPAGTPLGEKIRAIRYSVENLIGGIAFQLQTVELTSA
jgi:hypothetical protein